MNWNIPYFRHDLGEPEIQKITEVLKGDILTTGDFVAAFEQKFANLLEQRHALAVTSCTGALHMALLALDIGPGDEVITTPMSFVATATAILEAGATPIFVDAELDTGNIDAAQIEAAITPRTKAIMPVHLYGLMCDMLAIKAIADRHGLRVIEDSAHCIEGMRDGIRPGTLSDAACFSFYATKNLICGEGGAITTNDDTLADKLRLLRLHGMTRTGAQSAREGYRHWDMVAFGWKYNMSNIEAAMLLPQFDRIADKLKYRHRLADRYTNALSAVDRVLIPATRPNSTHARHVFTAWIDRGSRDELIQFLHNHRIGAVVNYRPIHLMSYFVERYGFKLGDFPKSEWIGERTISLPFYPGMPFEHVDIIAASISNYLATVKDEIGV